MFRHLLSIVLLFVTLLWGRDSFGEMPWCITRDLGP